MSASSVPTVVQLDSTNEEEEEAKSVSFELLQSCQQVANDKWAKHAKQR